MGSSSSGSLPSPYITLLDNTNTPARLTVQRFDSGGDGRRTFYVFSWDRLVRSCRLRLCFQPNTVRPVSHTAFEFEVKCVMKLGMMAD